MEIFNEIWLYFVLALAGHFAHILSKLVKLERKGIKFSMITYISENKFSMILGFMLSTFGVMMYHSLNELSYLNAILSGYAADSMMQNFMKRSKKDESESE